MVLYPSVAYFEPNWLKYVKNKLFYSSSNTVDNIWHQPTMFGGAMYKYEYVMTRSV